MDRLLARRLDEEKDFRARLVKLAKDYLKLGRDSLAFYSPDFDHAYDVFNCYSPMTKKEFKELEAGHPKRFILPLTATQITTMTTYIAQVLFGQETPWKVEGRRPEDEIPAEFVNNLLRWNAEQQQSYTLGYLWVQDCLLANRGVFYNSWAPIFKPEMTMVPVPDPSDLDEGGQPKIYFRPTRKEKVVGNYCRMEIVASYDWVSDPALPLWRMQEMRFVGHRTVIPVTELRRRSRLPIEHPAYVLPSAVEDLVAKAKKGVAQSDPAVPSIPGIMPNPAEMRLSRTAYERTRNLQPTGQTQADKNDTGNVEVWELWVRLVPSENHIYGDEEEASTDTGLSNLSTGTASVRPQSDAAASAWLNISSDVNPSANGDFIQHIAVHDEPCIFQILVAGGDVLLAINESTYAHGMYPYSVAEGRPSAHFQFSPSWAVVLKGIQDYVDWLKNRHQEALARTIGNIFVYDPQFIDVTDFLDPNKEGLLIAKKPEAAGQKMGDIFQQIPIKDLTENFLEEAMEFIKFSQTVTAADSGMQGAIPNGADPSATQFAGTMQMGAGRMTSIARLLSSQALVPQAKQFVSMFQQFMDGKQMVRFKPTNPQSVPPELQMAAAVELSRDAIAGEYDFIAHDGTLPGTDGRKVAAIMKLLEAAQGFPQCFTPAPGNIDPKKLLLMGAKVSGLNVENYCYDKASLPTPPGAPMPPGAPPQPPAPGISQPPGPAPAQLAFPPLQAPDLTSVRPPQPRPTNT